MNAIRRHLVFSVWMALCLTLLSVGFWQLQKLRQSVRHEQTALARNTQERERLRQAAMTSPDLTPDAPDSDARPAVAVLVEDGEIPRRPLDAFIAIAGTGEELRRLAASQAVALLPGESFGFGTYAHTGPALDQLSAVHRQLRLTRQLVTKLFLAHPDKLLAVRREPVRSPERESGKEVTADFFRVEPGLDLRTVGLIEGQAIQLEFSGATPVLRDFLNALAVAPEPLCVRKIEVEPLGEDTKFSVVVELAEPVSGIGEQSVPPPVLWEKAAASPANADQRYELFARPDKIGRERDSANLARTPVPSAEKAVTEGFELLAVKREPYRLQLVGYYGQPGDYTVAFIRPGISDTLLVREGHHFESLGLVLQEFALKKLATPVSAGRAGFETTPWAQLWDERTQMTVTLVGREHLLTDTPLAVFRLGTVPQVLGEFRRGDSFPDGDATCRIEHIQLDPAEVVIVRQMAGQLPPERRILQPTPHTAPPARTDLVAADRRR